jgi:hypothetical protein
MDKSASWDPNIVSQIVMKFPDSMEPEHPLPSSQTLASGLKPEPQKSIPNPQPCSLKIYFNTEWSKKVPTKFKPLFLQND